MASDTPQLLDKVPYKCVFSYLLLFTKQLQWLLSSDREAKHFKLATLTHRVHLVAQHTIPRRHLAVGLYLRGGLVFNEMAHPLMKPRKEQAVTGAVDYI